MSKEAMKLALEALTETYAMTSHAEILKHKAITALREALAEQPAVQQEPVAWVCYGSNNKHDIDFFEDEIADLAVGTMLYTHAQRTWVGLTDEEIEARAINFYNPEMYKRAVLWAQEKLKERNQ